MPAPRIEPVSRVQGGASKRDDARGHVAPSDFTARANAAVLDALPFDDSSDFENAKRGLLGSREDPIIRDAEGREVWNLAKFSFETGDSPDSVSGQHPSPSA